MVGRQVLLAVLGTKQWTSTSALGEVQGMGVYRERTNMGHGSNSQQTMQTLRYMLLQTNKGHRSKRRHPSETMCPAGPRQAKHWSRRITAHDLWLHQRHRWTLYAKGELLEPLEIRTNVREDNSPYTHPSTWPHHNSHKYPKVALVSGAHKFTNSKLQSARLKPDLQCGRLPTTNTAHLEILQDGMDHPCQCRSSSPLLDYPPRKVHWVAPTVDGPNPGNGTDTRTMHER